MKNCVRWSGVKLSLFGLTIVQYLKQFSLILTPWCETWDIIASSAAWTQSCGTLGRNSHRGERTASSSSPGRHNETRRHDPHQPSLLSIWYRLDRSYRDTLTASEWQPGSGEDCFPPPARVPGWKENKQRSLALGWRDGIYNIYYLPPHWPCQGLQVRLANYISVFVCWHHSLTYHSDTLPSNCFKRFKPPFLPINKRSVLSLLFPWNLSEIWMSIIVKLDEREFCEVTSNMMRFAITIPSCLWKFHLSVADIN